MISTKCLTLFKESIRLSLELDILQTHLPYLKSPLLVPCCPEMSGLEEGFTKRWEIDHFGLLPHQRGDALRSPGFAVDTWPGTEWSLELYPRGDSSEAGEGSVSLHFKKVPDDVELKISYTLALESAELGFDITLTDTDRAISEGRTCPALVSRSYLDENRRRYLPRGVMTVRFHLWPAARTTEQLESEAYSLSEIRTFRSGIQVQDRSVTWPIRDIDTIGNFVERSFFGVSKGSPGLGLTLNLRGLTNEDFVPVEIRQTHPVVEGLFVNCRMSVVTSERDCLVRGEGSNLFASDVEDVWHFPPFIKSNNLVRGEYLDSEGKLRVKCDFTFSCKDAVYHWEYNCFPCCFGLSNDSKLYMISAINQEDT